MKHIKSFIKKTLQALLPEIIINVLKKLNRKRQLYLKEAAKKQKDKAEFETWLQNGAPTPPPHIAKQHIIKEYQQKYHIDILVETGTFLGIMVEAQKKRFKKIISIELGIELFEAAQIKFANDKHITIIQGDSGKVLPKILETIEMPAIFWLDGHYSEGITAQGDKDCPIFEELDAIFGSSNKLNHILLIDDARCFIGTGDYPTIENLTKYVKAKNENYQVEVKHDVIRYTV